MVLLRLGVTIAAIVGSLINGVLFLLTFTRASFFLNAPFPDMPSSAMSTPLHSGRGSDLAQLSPILIGGIVMLVLLIVLTSIVMPAPYHPNPLVNWVLKSAYSRGGWLSLVNALVIVGIVLLPSLMHLRVDKQPARHGEEQGTLVREIDHTEVELLTTKETQDLNRLFWRALSAVLSIDYLTIVGYGAWYLRRQPAQAP